MSLITVGILQNLWFKNVETAKRVYYHYKDREGEERGRLQFIRDMLFFGSLTGRRLIKAFGESMCEYIIWEESNLEFGRTANTSYPSDETHLVRVINRLNPNILIAFGNIAKEGLCRYAVSELIKRRGIVVINAVHPASRDDAVNRLRGTANELREAIYAANTKAEKTRQHEPIDKPIPNEQPLLPLTISPREIGL